jgi:hypothetical protein
VGGRDDAVLVGADGGDAIADQLGGRVGAQLGERMAHRMAEPERLAHQQRPVQELVDVGDQRRRHVPGRQVPQGQKRLERRDASAHDDDVQGIGSVVGRHGGEPFRR